MFPTGVLLDCLSVFLAINIGILLKSHVSDAIKDPITTTCGFSAIAMGIVSIVKLQYLPAVILALILGSVVGELTNLDHKVKAFFLAIILKFNFKIDGDKDEYMRFYLIVTAIFCASGTGIFGAITEGASGDMTVMISKTVLDFFSALIFATTLGKAMNLIVIPQIIILCACFYGATWAMPYITASMLSDFIAVGGIITFIIGMNVTKIKIHSPINLLPALIFIWPCSYFFSLVM